MLHMDAVQCVQCCVNERKLMENQCNTEEGTLLESDIANLQYRITGASPGFGRGWQEIIFRFGNLHVAMRIVWGFGGILSRENFLKRCNLVRFRVYFDQILCIFFFQNYHFLYKK